MKMIKGSQMPPEQRVKISVALTGRIQSREHVEHNRVAQVRASTPEVRARIGASVKRAWTPKMRARHAEVIAQLHAAGHYFKGPTKLELALRRLLCGAGFDFDEQIRFGRYVVDAWVSSHGLVFEADGSFWHSHQDKGREARRDAYLMECGVVAVVHLTEEDLL
jgi:very-short-patch-repair endonuclease